MAVERRERTLRWIALMAAEGRQEPPSLLTDARRRFDYFAELLAILAEHSGCAFLVCFLVFMINNALICVVQWRAIRCDDSASSWPSPRASSSVCAPPMTRCVQIPFGPL